MIILASAVIISLSNSNIINKTNEAVNASNLKQVQQMATLLWEEAYLDENIKTDEQYEEYVKGKLEDNNIKLENYHIEITANGVKVEKKGENNEEDDNDNEVVEPTITLGSLITSAEIYGTKINYEANGVTDWKVFYSQTVNGEEYVYLIASEKLAYSAYYDGNGNLTELGTKLANSGATINKSRVGTKTVGQIYWSTSSNVPSKAATIQNPTLWMAEWGKYDSYSTNPNGRCVSYFLDETVWSDFANKEDYKDINGNSYVVGAIGTPTAEMFVASWNAKRLTETNTSKVELTLTANGTTGYILSSTLITTSDPLYIWSTDFNSPVWLASPYGYVADNLLYAGSGSFASSGYTYTIYGVRPVVCLKSSIPVSLVDGNFVIK